MDSKLDSLPFLDRLAEELVANSNEQALIAVLPNRRSQFMLMEKLEVKPDFDISRVEFRTADQLMEELSGKQLIEPGEALVAFYRAYISIESKPQEFEEFSKWAVTFLSDMNDVDLHLGDMGSLFKQISEYQTTDLEQGPIEQHFRTFWERLPGYYDALRKELNAIELRYRGLLYRNVAEMADGNDERLTSFFGHKKVCWIGVVPGNKSEQQLLKWIQTNAKLEIFIDVDGFYMENISHEAGRLFRSDVQLLKAKWKIDRLRTGAYDVNIHPVSGYMGQLFRAKDLVLNLPREANRDTVIVLSDPNLFSPFLAVFKEQQDALNISAGISLKSTTIHKVVMAWMQVHALAIDRAGEIYFHQSVLKDFLKLPLVDRWFGGSGIWDKLEGQIIAKNWKYVTKAWMKQQFSGDMFAEGAFQYLFEWESNFVFVFERVTNALKEWTSRSKELGFTHLDTLALPIYIQKLQLVFSQFNDVFIGTDLRVLRKFMHRQIGFGKVNIQQGNNDGIQVMSMLETRMVDFKRVILIGASDDVLPGNPVNATLIPFVHRIHHKLPTKQDTQALVSYHFYRLIQRAEVIHMIYNTSSEAMTSGEPSRFILQMKQEWSFVNKRVSIKTIADDGFIEPGAQKGLQIHKTKNVIDDLNKALASRISPSAINNYINSPLEFYFYYVLKLKEQERVEEEMEASTFGTAIHNVIEQIYTPFIGQFIDIQKLEAALPALGDMVEAEFQKSFELTDLKQGLNYVQVELAKSYVETFITYDVEDMKANGVVKILHLEKRLSATLPVAGLDVRLFGFADRIDKRNNVTRIIDYKTGKVIPNDLKCSISELFHDPKKSKALQLACYKWTYLNEIQATEAEVLSCIYSCRSHQEGYMPLVISTEESEFMASFQSGLTSLIQDMQNPVEPFEHRPESKYTTF